MNLCNSMATLMNESFLVGDENGGAEGPGTGIAWPCSRPSVGERGIQRPPCNWMHWADERRRKLMLISIHMPMAKEGTEERRRRGGE